MPTTRWTSEDIARITGGEASGDAFVATGVTVDSRNMLPGDLFVALSGKRDSHAFVPGALAVCAAGALVSKPVDGPAVRVPDTLAALWALAAVARDNAMDARRIAVTGSVGKTSVTQAIAAALRLAGPSHNSIRSYNNHIGVPLTLAKMPAHTLFAVFEAGMNHADELRPLSKLIRPHVAVVTTVASAHLEFFPEGEIGVARAKAEIFEGLTPDGVAILNRDNRWFDLLSETARAQGAQVIGFGKDAASEGRLTDFEPDADGSGASIVADIRGRRLDFRIAQSGLHWGHNSMAVLLALDAAGVDLDRGLEALAAFEALPGRGQQQTVSAPDGAALLVDDSYNANPLSMTGALATLGRRSVAGRRIIAVTDMLELGPDSAERHAALVQAVTDAEVDLVFAAGPLMKSLYDALPAALRGAWRQTAAELGPLVCAAVRAGDVVLVKGSNGSRASTIAEALRHLGRDQ